MPVLYAQPYAIGATGFRFESLDEYEEKSTNHDREEFEIEFLDGSPEEADLFEVAGISQPNLDCYFEILDLESHEQIQVAALLHSGTELDDALLSFDEVNVVEAESAKDWAIDWI